MVQEHSTGDPPTPERERRRGVRTPLSVPIEVMWQNRDNVTLREEAETLEVSVYGAILQMKTTPPIGTQIQLTNHFSKEVAQAQVIATRPTKFDAVAVELLVPSETFWGVTFRLKRAATELRTIEEEIKSGGADPQVLREFRESVDYVRKTAWAVYEWQERQFKHKDAATVLSLLTSERVRRATQLNQAIVADLGTHQLTPDSPGIPEFLKAIERTAERLRSEGMDDQHR